MTRIGDNRPAPRSTASRCDHAQEEVLDVLALSAPEPRPFDPDLVCAMVAHIRQKQARALHYKGDVEDLDSPATRLSIAQLAKACRRDLMGLRALALLLANYDTGFRRSEMVAIDVGDIDGPDQKGAGPRWLAVARPSRRGEGAFAYLSPATMRAIMQAYRWRDPRTVPRYGARLAARSGASARTADD